MCTLIREKRREESPTHHGDCVPPRQRTQRTRGESAPKRHCRSDHKDRSGLPQGGGRSASSKVPAVLINCICL